MDATPLTSQPAHTGPAPVMNGVCLSAPFATAEQFLAALAARDLLTRAGQAVVRAVLAVNRVYLPHPLIKWQRHLITGLEVVPDRLAGRLESMAASPPAEAFRAAEALLEDTVALAEAHTGADLSEFRQALAQRRRPLDPPPAGP